MIMTKLFCGSCLIIETPMSFIAHMLIHYDFGRAIVHRETCRYYEIASSLHGFWQMLLFPFFVLGY